VDLNKSHCECQQKIIILNLYLTIGTQNIIINKRWKILLIYDIVYNNVFKVLTPISDKLRFKISYLIK